MGQKLLSLVMIVKDEATNIKAVLEAVKPHIDSWCIIDTGSTDSTQKIVLETLEGVPGKLLSLPFVDFAETRNVALKADAEHNGATFQLMLSGDEYLTGGDLLRLLLTDRAPAGHKDLFRIKLIIDNVSFNTPRIFRTGSEWKYTGIIDEVPTHPDPIAESETLKGPAIEHVISDREKRLDDIWTKHIPLLEAKLNEDPDDAQTLASLAQKYEAFLFGPGFSAGERITYAMRVMSLYVRRLALRGMSDAEANYYRMRYLTTARLTGVYEPAEMLTRVKELADEDPTRPETALLLVHAASRVMPVQEVYALAAHAAIVASNAKHIANDSPVSLDVEWQAHFIAAKCAKQIAAKHPDAGLEQLTFSELADIHIKQGIAAGGPRAQFQALMDPPKTNGSNGTHALEAKSA